MDCQIIETLFPKKTITSVFRHSEILPDWEKKCIFVPISAGIQRPPGRAENRLRPKGIQNNSLPRRKVFHTELEDSRHIILYN